MPFSETSLQEKVHQTFRLKYIRDFVLGTSVSESTQVHMSAMILLNHHYIITYIATNQDWLKSVLKVILESNDDVFHEQLLFISELLDLSQYLEAKNKQAFHQ